MNRNLQAGRLYIQSHKKIRAPERDAHIFYFALGKLPKPLFVLLPQIKEVLFFGICIIWCSFCEEWQSSQTKLFSEFIGGSKRIGGGNDGMTSWPSFMEKTPLCNCFFILFMDRIGIVIIIPIFGRYSNTDFEKKEYNYEFSLKKTLL